MSEDWAAQNAEAMPTPAEPVVPDTSGADMSALTAQITAMQTQMQAMQQSHQGQMQAIYGAMGSGQQAPAPAPAKPVIAGIDEDDPYYDQFSSVMQTQIERNNSLQGQVAELKGHLQNMTLSLNQQNVEQQVNSALERHNVPQSLAEDIKTVAYAYMASAPQGQHVSADSMVAKFMQNLGHWATEARKEWSAEANKPRPVSIAAGMAGVPDQAPQTMAEAKERSLAIMKAMIPGG